MKKLTFFLISLAMVFIFCGITYADLNDGLVAYYPFNGNANDASGHGNNGTAYGGVSYVDGINGLAANFDGIDDYIRVPTDSSFNFGTTDFSISCFINVRNVAREQHWSSGAIINKRYTDDIYYTEGSNQWNLSYRLENAVRFMTHSYGDSIVITDNDLQLNTNYHVAAIREGEVMSIYIDGDLAAQETNAVRDVTTPMDLFIGVDGRELLEDFDSKHYFDGIIDDVRIYDRALSESEIQELYSSSVVPEPTIDAILNFFDNSVYKGLLEGKGRGRLANVRLCLFRKMLETAGWLIEKDKMKPACFTLHRAYLRCDGKRRRLPDFIIGEAVPELAEMIQDVMDDLGCE